MDILSAKKAEYNIRKLQRYYKNKNQLRESMVEGFAAITNWTTANGLSVSLDTTNYITGGAAVKFTQAAPNTSNNVSYLPGLTLDLSDAQTLEFTVYCSDVSKFSQFLLYLYTASGAFKVTVGSMINGWNVFRFTPSDFSIDTGTPAWSQTFTQIAVLLTSTSGQTASITFDSLKKNVKNTPIISFVFDDNFSSLYDIVKPLFESRGLKFSAAINSFEIGNAGHTTLAQLQEIYKNGHDILNHSKAHADFSTLTYSQAVRQVQDMQNFMFDNGWTRGSDIYVHATSWTTMQEQACKDMGYAVARDVMGSFNYYTDGKLNGSGFQNPYRLKTVFTDNTTTLSTLTTYVDKIVPRGGWLIFSAHDVAAAATTKVTSTSILTSLLDYSIASGAKIMSMSDAYDSFYN